MTLWSIAQIVGFAVCRRRETASGSVRSFLIPAGRGNPFDVFGQLLFVRVFDHQLFEQPPVPSCLFAKQLQDFIGCVRTGSAALDSVDIILGQPSFPINSSRLQI